MRNETLTERSRATFEAEMTDSGFSKVWLDRNGPSYTFLEVRERWQLWCAALAFAENQRPEFTER